MIRHKIKTITAILIAACMATAADIEQFVFQVTTTAANQYFSIPLSGPLSQTTSSNYTKAYNWTIDWGDESELQNASGTQPGNANSGGISHPYATAGTYTITIKPAEGSSNDAWLGAFGFANNTNGANTQANKNMVRAIISPLTPLMTRTQTQLDNGTAPSRGEWQNTFLSCQNLTMGKDFTFSESWNSITAVGDYFANDMFAGVNGDLFNMNSVFNLPQGITTVGIYFAYNMFNNVSGGSFNMNSVFNLPQGITTVGTYFAATMFFDVTGSSFKVNDVFKFPALRQDELDKGGVFIMTFGNSSAISEAVQTRTAASIINNTLVPTATPNRQTFTNNNRFLDRDYIATEWGGNNSTTAVIAITTHPAPTTNLTFGSISGNLSANASIAIALPIAYQWHSNTENSNEGGTPIEDATDAAFEIPADLTAGTHYFYCVASTKDGAYPVVSDVATVTVKKIPVAKPTLATPTTFIYNGTEKTVVPAEESDLYEITAGGTQTNAGEYQATVSLTDPSSYKWTDTNESEPFELDWEITQAEQETLAITQPEEKEYGSGNFSLETTGGSSTGSVSYSIVSGEEFISIEGNTVSILKAGSATITATKAADNNYKSATSEPVTITIAPLTVTVIPNAASKIYGTSDPALTYTTSPASPVNWVQENITLKRTEGENVNTYTITIDTDNSGGNYAVELSETSVEFEITQATITADNAADFLSFAITSHTYNGEDQGIGEVTLKAAFTEAGTITVKYDGSATAPKNAGTYAITADIAGGTNFAIASDVVLGEYIIAPADLANAEITIAGGSTYNATQQTPAVTQVKIGELTLDEEDDYTVSHGENINAGTTAGTVTISVAANTNFTGTKTANFEIARATITNDNATDFLSFEIPTGDRYNGTDRPIEITLKPAFSEAGAITVKYNDVTTAPRNANTYAVTADIAGGTNFAAASNVAIDNYIITPKPLTLTNGTVASKIYDGTDLATIATYPAIAAGEVISADEGEVTLIPSTVKFASTNANTNIAIERTGNWTLNGDRASNYEIAAQPTFPNAEIEAKPISVAVTTAGITKEYNGNTAVTTPLSYEFIGLVTADNAATVNASSITAEYTSKDAASDIAISFTGSWGIDGALASNYAISGPTEVKGDITQIQLSWNTLGTVKTKNYNGTTDAEIDIAPSLIGILSGEESLVTVADGTIAFSNANAGATVAASGWGIDGTGKGNYLPPVEQPVFAGTIEKANPTHTIPANLTATQGDLLSTVTLPDGWSWDNPSEAVGEAGEQTHKAIFTPEDPENYNTLTNIEVTITVSKGSTPIVRAKDFSPQQPQSYYNLKGTPLGTIKPTIPGVYIEKQGKQTKKITIR